MLDWLRSSGDGTDDDASPGEDLLGDAEWGEEDAFDDGMGLDGFDDGAVDDGADVDELFMQVDELDEALGSVSSTVNALEHDNEELRDDMEDIKDNVRKLLEIYEMVTRGINPFADDDPFDTNIDSSSFDIFGSDGDDFDAEEGFDDAELDLDDEFDEMEAFEVDDDEEAFDEPPEEEPPEDGRSFDDLKAEFDDEAIDDTEEELAEDVDDAEAATPDTDASVFPRWEASNGADGVGSRPRSGILGEKPYLRQLPEGYAIDLVIMQWLSELREDEGTDSIADTVEYYASIGWISPSVADELQAYVPGLDAVDLGTAPVPSSSVDVDVHKRSLQFIHHLATTTSRRIVVTDVPDGFEALLDDDGADDGFDPVSLAARTDGGGFWAGIEGYGDWLAADTETDQL